MSDRRFVVYLGQKYPNEIVAGESNLTGGYVIADWLEPIHCSHVANGEIGELRCVASKHPEVALGLVSNHQALQVLDFKDDEDGVTVFDGVIVKRHYTYRDKTDLFEIVAYNSADYLMHRIALSGQYRLSYTKEQALFSSGTSTSPKSLVNADLNLNHANLIFNPEGEPNATDQLYYFNSDNTNTFRVFEAPFRSQVNSSKKTIKAVYWTLKDAVAYLFHNYNSDWAINKADLTTTALGIFDVHGNPNVNNVNLQGKTLLEGLHTLLEPHGYGFYVSPEADGNPAVHRLTFFYRGEGTSKDFKLAARGTTANATNSNLISCDIVEDTTPVINCITAYGDQKTFTILAHTDPPTGPTGSPSSSSSGAATTTQVLKLVKGWDDANITWPTPARDDGGQNTFDTQFRKDYCSPDLWTVLPSGATAYGVGRMWLVNVQGENPTEDLEDLTTKLADDVGDSNSTNPRKMEKPELYAKNGAGGVLKQEELVVEMSLDSGDNWFVVERSYYRILNGVTGIVLSNPKLERLGQGVANSAFPEGYDYWSALHDGQVQIRIVCGIKSDAKVNALLLNFGDQVPLATERVFNNDGYKKGVYSTAINDTVYYTKNAPDQNNQNDKSILHDLAELQQSNSDRILYTGTAVVVLNNWREYNPGDCITGITGRGISYDPRPTIQRVVYDFVNQHVQITLDSKNVRTVLNARPDDAADRDASRLHLGSPSQFTGGTQVPFLPGVRSSQREFFREGGGE